MKCVLSRVEWDWIVERVNNQPVWKCSELATPVWSHQFAAGELPGATGRFEITCPGGGCYRLEATDQATGSQTVVQFYACDAEEGELGQLVQQPQRLDIVLDKKTYLPGESAKVLVRSPLAGTMLLTLESDSVLEQRVIDLPRKTTTVDLPLPAALRGGAFVTATVVAPIDPSRPKWLPHRALGVARVELNTAPHRMELSVDAPDKAQPSQKVLVHVKTAPPTDPLHPPMLHLWAVDEGILLTTAFATPSPLDHFLAQRRLEVESSDLYDQLMPDYQRPAGITSIGGGDEADRVRIRSSPIAVRTRAPAVIWRTAVPVGPDGTTSAELEMPKLSGQMRIMAVCVDHDRYGSAQKPVIVTSDLLVEAAWPRFAAPGDTFLVPIKVFNTTSKRVTAGIWFKVEGPLAVGMEAAAIAKETTSGPASKPDVAVMHDTGCGEVFDAGTSDVLWAHARATGLGQVKVTVRVQQDAFEVSGATGAAVAECENLFTVRPAAPLEIETRLAKLEAGKSLALTPLADFLPEASRTTLTIASRADVDLLPALEQLIDYPYGCVEQTTSKLYVMLYAPELMKLQARPRAAPIPFAN